MLHARRSSGQLVGRSQLRDYPSLLIQRLVFLKKTLWVAFSKGLTAHFEVIIGYMYVL